MHQKIKTHLEMGAFNGFQNIPGNSNDLRKRPHLTRRGQWGVKVGNLIEQLTFELPENPKECQI